MWGRDSVFTHCVSFAVVHLVALSYSLATWYSVYCSVLISQCQKDKVYKLYFQATIYLLILHQRKASMYIYALMNEKHTWNDCGIFLKWNSLAVEESSLKNIWQVLRSEGQHNLTKNKLLLYFTHNQMFRLLSSYYFYVIVFLLFANVSPFCEQRRPAVWAWKWKTQIDFTQSWWEICDL